MPIHAPGTPYLVQAVSTTVRTVRRTRPVAGQTYVCTYLYALRLWEAIAMYMVQMCSHALKTHTMQR